jgi:hypothetical protein
MLSPRTPWSGSAYVRVPRLYQLSLQTVVRPCVVPVTLLSPASYSEQTQLQYGLQAWSPSSTSPPPEILSRSSWEIPGRIRVRHGEIPSPFTHNTIHNHPIPYKSVELQSVYRCLNLSKKQHKLPLMPFMSFLPLKAVRCRVPNCQAFPLYHRSNSPYVFLSFFLSIQTSFSAEDFSCIFFYFVLAQLNLTAI